MLYGLPVLLTLDRRTVQGCKLRGDKLSEDIVDGSNNIDESSLQDIRCQGEKGGVRETECILRQTLKVVDATGQIGQVNASEAVDCSHVSSHSETFGYLELNEGVVGAVTGDGVVDTDGSTVPVIADNMLY
jgi:hypothetical protein